MEYQVRFKVRLPAKVRNARSIPVNGLFLRCAGLMLAFQCAAQASALHAVYSLDNDWSLRLGTAGHLGRKLYLRKAHVGLNASTSFSTNVPNVRFPHEWAMHLMRDSPTMPEQALTPLGFEFPSNSIGWYGRTLELAVETVAERRLWLACDGLCRDAKMWFDGYCLGDHEPDYTSFHYDVTTLVKAGGYRSFGAPANVPLYNRSLMPDEIAALARAETPANPVLGRGGRLDPAMAPVEDVAGLPRVLLIGDSVSLGYTVAVRKELVGKANVHHPPANCGSTRTGLRDLDKWLGTKKWHVIHFNWGLHDLGYRFDNDSNLSEKNEYARPDNGGHQNVPPAEYEKNLRELVVRLKKTGAKLICATTTPVPADLHSYVRGAEAPYNEVARRVMREQGVPLDDLWAFATHQLDKIQIPGNPHFTAKGSEVLARQVVRAIESALASKNN